MTRPAADSGSAWRAGGAAGGCRQRRAQAPESSKRGSDGGVRQPQRGRDPDSAGIAFLVLGPGRLPEAGKAVGKGLREFKRALNQARDELEPPDAPDPPPGRDRDPPRRLLD